MTRLAKKSWALWRHQIKALALREIGRNLAGRRAIPLVLIASVPVLLAVLEAIFFNESHRGNIGHTVTKFAYIFQYVFLRLILFFTCASMFVKLFRGEILERSLHFLLLAPVRRTVLVAGKFLGGAVTALLLFVPSIIATYLIYLAPHGGEHLKRFFSTGDAIGQLGSYTLIVILACIGYGAIFMLSGLFFKNPMIPAIVLLSWEMLVPFLPQFLKAFSLIFYLTSLAPVPVSHGPFSFIAQPAPDWLAVLALLAGSAVLVGIASLKARHMEISYTSE